MQKRNEKNVTRLSRKVFQILQTFSTYFHAFLHAQFSAVIDMFLLLLFFEFWCPRVALVMARQTLPTDGFFVVLNKYLIRKKHDRDERCGGIGRERQENTRKRTDEMMVDPILRIKAKEKRRTIFSGNCIVAEIMCKLSEESVYEITHWFAKIKETPRWTPNPENVFAGLEPLPSNRWSNPMVDGTCDGDVTHGDTNVWKDLNVMHEKTNDVRTRTGVAQEQVGMSLGMGRRPATKHRKYAQKRNCIHTAFGQLCGVFFFLKKRRETDKQCGVKRDAQR